MRKNAGFLAIVVVLLALMAADSFGSDIGARKGEKMDPKTLSEVVPLKTGLSAFMARAALIQRAKSTIDLQYYIWKNDISGLLLLGLLREAAERGVKVRILIDDNNSKSVIPHLRFLDENPLVEVKLFNPVPWRSWRWLAYLTHFSIANRRMHNKSLTIDGGLSIVGGRNVGDEYFDLSPETSFIDLDVVVKGPVVPEISKSFEAYWRSARSLPLSEVEKVGLEEAEAIWRRDRIGLESSHEAAAYRKSIEEAKPTFLDSLEQIVSPVHFLVDEPSKVEVGGGETFGIVEKLGGAMGSPQKSLLLVTPYFVPGEVGTQELENLSKKGIRVAVITNSLSATDVPAVHGGYEKRRRALLKAGVELYETKSNSGKSHGISLAESFHGSSRSSLHAKTFGIDGGKVFVGSFNLDPRSVRLNTELGVVVESPVLAK